MVEVTWSTTTSEVPLDSCVLTHHRHFFHNNHVHNKQQKGRRLLLNRSEEDRAGQSGV